MRPHYLVTSGLLLSLHSTSQHPLRFQPIIPFRVLFLFYVCYPSCNNHLSIYTSCSSFCLSSSHITRCYYLAHICPSSSLTVRLSFSEDLSPKLPSSVVLFLFILYITEVTEVQRKAITKLVLLSSRMSLQSGRQYCNHVNQTFIRHLSECCCRAGLDTVMKTDISGNSIASVCT